MTEPTKENIIVCQHGKRRGIWCRTQLGYDRLIAEVEQRRDAQGMNLGVYALMGVAPVYKGFMVRVAKADEWAALERDMAEEVAGRSTLATGERDG